MSVNLVFSQNLRLLCSERGSIAAATRAVDVSKVQFQRYLRGESFPKPNVLQKLCQHFGVDARILLEPLGEQGQDTERVSDTRIAAMNWCLKDAELAGDESYLEAGLYSIWRRSMAYRNKYTRVLVQLSYRGEIACLRGYDAAALYAPVSSGESKEMREFRGLLYRQGTKFEFAAMFFHSAPHLIISFMQLMPNVRTAHKFLTGYVAISRASHPYQRRIANCVLIKEEVTPKLIVQLAHASDWMEADDVPAYVLPHISDDVVD